MRKHFIILILLIVNTQAAKLLFLCGLGVTSHYNFYRPIAKALAERGHEVSKNLLNNQ